MDISEDRKFKRFLQNRNIKPQTKRLYTDEIRFYCEFLDRKPSELIEEAINEEKSGLWVSERRIKEYLLDYKSYLIDKNYSNKNLIKKMTIVKSFYNEFEIQIPRIKLQNKHKHETFEDLPTMDEIRKALKFANTKYQAIIFMMLSTGLRSIDIRHLKYSDFLNSLNGYVNLPKNTFVPIDEVIDLLNKNPEEKILTWKIITQKNDSQIIIFTTPECVDALLLYLEKNPPTHIDSPLFSSQMHKDKPISAKSFQNYFRYINDKCDFGRVGPYRKFHSHVLRKLFGTLLNADGMPHLSVERLLGHSVKDIVDAYIKVDENSLKQQYIEHMNVLSLENIETRVLTTDDKKEFLEMKQELAAIKKALADKNDDKLNNLFK